MKLSLSVRVAENASKRDATHTFAQLTELAASLGYEAMCMRASQVGIHSPLEQITAARKQANSLNLKISMVTGDFPVPLNNDEGPDGLRNITPYLDLTELLGADLIRIAMKVEEDIEWAQRAADEAAERGIRLAHQSHTQSLFETVEGSIDVLKRVGRENFGIIYEPANLDLCAQDYGVETLKRFSPYLFNVYLQNHIRRPEGRTRLLTWIQGEVPHDPIRLQDEGGIDFTLVFRGLEAIGYDGYVTVHQAFREIMEPEDAAEQSYAYLKPFEN
ncbi:MAG: sugar phosphate isomerase/epimerase [Candidatus Poribacteria bacterium]|nr:sugar phosphate isomerase/epimerase [Candidatus Poribacteria bacterium]